MTKKSSSSLATTAFAKLERMIVTLELAPGQELTESNLADLMLMGRSPVREAMQRLQGIGLLEIRSRKGIKISDISLDDYRKVLEIRLRLEPLFAKAAASNADATQRQAVSACERMMIDSVQRSDMKLFLSADRAFDQIFAGAARNPFLTQALEPLQIHSRRFWFKFLAASGVRESANLHMNVMSRFVEGDVIATEQAMIELVREMIKRADEIVP